MPTTNVGFLSAIMWDGREPSLENQVVDATLGHAQASAPPTPDQVAEIVAFQKGIFTAQVFDHKAKFLTGDNAKGGPIHLSSQMADFFIGINDPLGGNPKGIPFTSQIFDLYRPWLSAGDRHHGDGDQQPMAGIEELFKNVNITDVWRHNDRERGMVSEHRRSVARRRGTIQQHEDQHHRLPASTMISTSRAFRDPAAPATTHRMSETIRSRRR
jgi:hypothetical protein